jgi:hypothetical protein
MTGPSNFSTKLNETGGGDDMGRWIATDVPPWAIYSVYCLPSEGISYSHICSVTLRHL